MTFHVLFCVEFSNEICFRILRILEGWLLEYNVLPYSISECHNTEVESRMGERFRRKRPKKKENPIKGGMSRENYI